MTDERREGEQDLADMIDSYLWDACEGEDLEYLEKISDEAKSQWLTDVRTVLNGRRVNLFWDQAGNMRRQTEAQT